MKTGFLGSVLKFFLVFLISGFVISIAFMGISKFFPSYDYNNYVSPKPSLSIPEFSGWIAWWEEEKGYALAQKFQKEIKSVSPVWFMVDNNLELSSVGTVNRSKVIQELKNSDIKILPSLGSELSGEKLSPLFNDAKKSDILISSLTQELKTLDVDGVDIDLEGIKKQDKKAFTIFLSKLADKLRKENLYLSITVHAQTGKIAWDGVEGQDLEEIGKIADEVRIMAYDEHSGDTKPGSIASLEWINDVAKYNFGKIPKDKIVIGIPSYGYVWTSDNSEGLQFDDFKHYLEGKDYKEKRENESGELVFEGESFSGWLSDSEAMIAKINLLRTLGINKFVIWHFGGMDEKFFYENWSR